MSAVWSLCECLWGNLKELELINLDESTNTNAYEIHQLRKQSLTKWLSEISNHRIEREVKLFRYHKVSF